MNIKKIISSVAPFIGTLIGGPFGGAAAKIVSGALLGRDDATLADIEQALSVATPEQLAALKKIDADYKVQMAQVGIDEKKLVTMDRDSARKREIEVKDYVPATLAILLTIGFFGLILTFMLVPLQSASKDIVEIMIGEIGTAWICAVSYYFGSSNDKSLK
jgi:hypothetical protein